MRVALQVAMVVVMREMALRWKGGVWATPLAFAGIVMMIFSLAIAPQPYFLRSVVPNLIWMIVLFSLLLALDRSFDEDYADGTLLLDLLAPSPPYLVMIARAFAIWLVSGLPLALILPFLGLSLDLPIKIVPILMISLFLGTPTLTLLGLFTNMLTLGARANSLLAPLLVLPFTLPVLIFGSSAVNAAWNGDSVRPYLLLETAPLTLALTLCPWATAIAARRSLRD